MEDNQPGFSKLIDGLSLICHPSTPAESISAVNVEIVATDEDLLITFCVPNGQSLLLPTWVTPARSDGLWKTTCFELFLQSEGHEGYFEFNFSPSTQWAAYRFSGYRSGMQELDMSIAPHIEFSNDEPDFILEVDLELAEFPSGALNLGLSVVIEEQNGTKSYWALRHPPGPPDFHHRDCFALKLAPPERA